MIPTYWVMDKIMYNIHNSFFRIVCFQKLSKSSYHVGSANIFFKFPILQREIIES